MLLWSLISVEFYMMLPILTVVDCGTLTDPGNGQVDYTAGATLGQTATYSCNTGYNLVGDSTRTCQATGEWSESAPTCQGMSLLTLSHPVMLYNILITLVFALPLSR